MLHIRKLLKNEWVHVPMECLLAVGGGYLLSLGTVSGIVSPLAAALAGISSPLTAFCILLGSLISYSVQSAPEGMRFLLTALACVTCVRMFFYDSDKPHLLGIMTAVSCICGGILIDFLFQPGEGRMPLYILESFLTGAAAFFVSDAIRSIQENQMISLNAGKSFTFAICYMLMITALCSIDFEFCNLGRIVGLTVTLLAAKQFQQAAGTLCGALTTCGVVLCSVSLGTPLLFLPVTAMLAGFLCKLPNAFFIPVFFLMQGLSSAVLDSSIGIIKMLIEVMIACTFYAVFCKTEFRRWIAVPIFSTAGQRQLIRKEKFMSDALQELRDETAAVMRHLKIAAPSDPVQQVRENLCQDCKYYALCWKKNQEQTERAFQQLLHTPSVISETLEDCLNKKRVSDMISVYAQRRALRQMQNTQLLQNREMTLEYLQLITNLTEDAARRRETQLCSNETNALRNILIRCAVSDFSCFVYQLKGGRYAAEIYTKQDEFPLATVQELLSRELRTSLKSISFRQKNCCKYCCYEIPEYHLEYEIRSRNAPAYERCGDHADAFTDAVGNQYLVISDGMGSGSAASLASRIAVRTFRSMICCEMPVLSAIRLVNAMLMTETNTENFATLDISFLNADTGELTCYKSGAAATLLGRENQMRKITSESFPVGIVPDAVPSKDRFRTQEDDFIIMLSDGVNESEYAYIKQLIAQNPDADRLLQEIFDKAPVFSGGTVRDDMTVIVARVRGKQPARKAVSGVRENSTEKHGVR